MKFKFRKYKPSLRLNLQINVGVAVFVISLFNLYEMSIFYPCDARNLLKQNLIISNKIFCILYKKNKNIWISIILIIIIQVINDKTCHYI